MDSVFLIPSLTTVRADNGGQAVLNPGWTHPHRRLTSSVVILGLRGTVRLEVDGASIEVVPGRIVFLPSGIGHRGVAPLEAPASYYWLHFTSDEDPVRLDEDEASTVFGSAPAAHHLLDDAALVPLSLDPADAERFKELFRDLLNQQEKRSYTPRKLTLLWQLFLVNLTEAVIADHRPHGAEGPRVTVVSEVTRYVAEHLADPNLSIKVAADEVGLNLDYVGRRFKRIMGVSVGEYILQQRIKLALVHLQQTQDTLEAIAARTGFGTVRHFLRQFKSRKGMTPTEARNTYRRMHFNVV